MRAAMMLSVAAALVFGGPAFAAQRVKPPALAHKPCSVPVSEFLSAIGGDGKLLVSPTLDASQYLLLRKGGQPHTKTSLPGDGAIIVGMPGDFKAILTEGVGADAKVCALMNLPDEFVEAIAEIKKGSAPIAKPADAPHRGEGV